jgi:uncharacterized membrane protein
MDWGDHSGHMSTGGWVFMALGMLVLIALVVALVIWLVSQQRKPAAGVAPPGMTAREALDHRLVSGEITPENYDALRSRLDPGTPPGAGPPAGTA